MTPATTDLLIAFLESLPSLIQNGVEVISLINKTVSSVKTMIAESRDPTAAEWNALHAQIAALSPGQPSLFPNHPV